jgi:hypothetical protein
MLIAICDEATVVNIPLPQQTIPQSESMIEGTCAVKEPSQPAQSSVVRILPSSSPESGALREGNSVGRQVHLEIVIPRLPAGVNGKKRRISESIVDSAGRKAENTNLPATKVRQPATDVKRQANITIEIPSLAG